jgi:hypothetical protein
MQRSSIHQRRTISVRFSCGEGNEDCTSLEGRTRAGATAARRLRIDERQQPQISALTVRRIREAVEAELAAKGYAKAVAAILRQFPSRTGGQSK